MSSLLFKIESRVCWVKSRRVYFVYNRVISLGRIVEKEVRYDILKEKY